MRIRGLDILFVLPALALGSWLRLRQLPHQVLLDDEWHALNYVIELPYSWLAKHAGGCATSPPMNLYTRFLLDHAGWSEMLLRLPSITAGLAGLVVLPWLAAKIFGRRVALVFSLVLAVSPFLVFYSSNARPYSLVVLLGGISVLSQVIWAQNTQRKGWAWLSIITGALAIWLHLFAAIAVFAPVAWGMILCLLPRPDKAAAPTGPGSKAMPPQASSSRSDTVEPRGFQLARRYAMFMLLLLALTAILVAPAVMNSLTIKMYVHGGKASLQPQALAAAAAMVSGTGHAWVAVVFWGLAAVGMVRMFRKSPLCGGGFVLGTLTYLLAFAIIRPDYINTPIVMCRYAIVLCPLMMLAAACGLEQVLCADPLRGFLAGNAFFTTTACLLCGGLFAVGPLPWIYQQPNSFLNSEIGFEQSLRFRPSQPADVARPAARTFPVTEKSLEEFYQTLGRNPGIRTVIEYPLVIGDQSNILGRYQAIHGKKVNIGYYSQLGTVSQPQGLMVLIGGKIVLTRECVRGDDTPDDIFSRVTDQSRLCLANMIDLSDPERVRKSGADLVILHKDMTSEWPPGRRPNITHPVVSLVARNYLKTFGPPTFEDNRVIVFKLKPLGTDKYPP